MEKTFRARNIVVKQISLLSREYEAELAKVVHRDPDRVIPGHEEVIRSLPHFEPYPTDWPATVTAPWSELDAVGLVDLVKGAHNPSKILIVSVVDDCATVECVYVPICDKDGEHIVCRMWNEHDPLRFPCGIVLVIKDPVILECRPPVGNTVRRTMNVLDVVNPFNCEILIPSSPVLKYFTSHWYTPPRPRDNYETLRLQGNEYFRSNFKVAAIDAYTRAIDVLAKSCEYDTRLHNNRAQCWLELGDYHRAIFDCEIVLKMDPNDYKANYRRANALMASRKWHEALVALNKTYEICSSEEGAEFRSEIHRIQVKQQKILTAIEKYSPTPMSSLPKTLQIMAPLMKRMAREMQFNTSDDIPDHISPKVEIREVDDGSFPSARGRLTGMFAIENIEAERIILIESPVVHSWRLPVHVTEKRLDLKFQSERGAEIDFNLSDLVAKLMKEGATSRSARMKIADLARIPRRSGRYWASEAPVSSLADLSDDEIVNSFSLLKPFVYANAESLNAPGSPIVKEQICGFAIFEKGSQINHCCLANCASRTFGNMFVVRTGKAIKAGEEITLNRISIHSDPIQRMEAVIHQGYVCHCRQCDEIRSLSPSELGEFRGLQAKIHRFATTRSNPAELQALLKTTRKIPYGSPHFILSDLIRGFGCKAMGISSQMIESFNESWKIGGGDRWIHLLDGLSLRDIWFVVSAFHVCKDKFSDVEVKKWQTRLTDLIRMTMFLDYDGRVF